MPSSPNPADLYVACFSDVHGWGGAITAARGLIATGRRRGLSSRLLGVSSQASVHPTLADWSEATNVRLAAWPLLWRCRSWRVSGQLGHYLRRLVPPRRAFVSLSPQWIVAAKRVWPNVPAVYMFPCLLSNCLPFTWPQRRPPTFWSHVDYAGIRHAEHLAFQHADLIVVPTEQARAEVLTFHPAAHGRVTVCTYGCEPGPACDTERTARRHALGLKEDDFALLAVGKCDLNKAFDWAIRELSAMNPRVRLVIVGDGPQHSSLRQLARQPGVSGRVRFAGVQTDLRAWYGATDGLVSTSYYDTFPNVVLEAMQSGRPVVVPQHAPPRVYAGAAEFVTQHGGGRVYDRQRQGALARVVNVLVADRHAAAELGAQARDVAQRMFDWGKCMDQVAGMPT